MGKGAQQVAEQPPPEPASAASAKASIGRWVVDGEEYDLTEFIPKHPGGMDMFVWANGRDITIPVYTYHKDPARTVLPLLKKYKVRTPEQPIEDVVKHKLGIPHFLLPPGFDAATDIPTYNFDPTDESQLLTTARKRVLAPDVQRTIRRLDDLFDGIIVCVVARRRSRKAICAVASAATAYLRCSTATCSPALRRPPRNTGSAPTISAGTCCRA